MSDILYLSDEQIQNATVVKSNNHPCCRHDKLATVINVNTGKFIEFNETCLALWDALDSHNKFSELFNFIVARFEVPGSQQLTLDICSALREMNKAKLVEFNINCHS